MSEPRPEPKSPFWNAVHGEGSDLDLMPDVEGAEEAKLADDTPQAPAFASAEEARLALPQNDLAAGGRNKKLFIGAGAVLLLLILIVMMGGSKKPAALTSTAPPQSTTTFSAVPYTPPPAQRNGQLNPQQLLNKAEAQLKAKYSGENPSSDAMAVFLHKRLGIPTSGANNPKNWLDVQPLTTGRVMLTYHVSDQTANRIVDLSAPTS